MYKISIYKSFEDLPKPYEEIFSKSSHSAGVFLSLPWFRNLVSQGLNDKSVLRIYAVESGLEDGKPCLVLPMRHDPAASPVLRRRELGPIANYYSSLFGPAVCDTAPELQGSLDLIARAIAADQPRWDTIDLHPMDADGPLFKGIIKAFRNAGLLVQSYFCFGNWYLEVGGRTYGEYFETLPSPLKNLLKRKSRRLEKSGRLRLEIVTDETDLEPAIATFEKIYNQSWKKPEPHPDFIPGLIRSCARSGWLRLGIAYVDGTPAAAQLWIVANGVASIYKLAYDRQFTNYSVGSILTAKLMQHVIDIDRVREVDYLSGDDPYKQHWMSHRRERWGIVAFNLKTFNGKMAAARHLGGRALRNITAAFQLKPSPTLNRIVEK